ncbi:hypothetical protein [Bacillus pseudomycoides]|uniref:hypothetical protein n=1 Tax=Bacillus pseudomycoides TaxID=64104 RepID=UPI0015CF043E|nr:hypothetical protein [Bacillus pseudomycoides]
MLGLCLQQFLALMLFLLLYLIYFQSVKHIYVLPSHIDSILGLENLVRAPNRVKGQHSIEALRNVVDRLREVRDNGGGRDDIVEKLRDLGDIAQRRRK